MTAHATPPAETWPQATDYAFRDLHTTACRLDHATGEALLRAFALSSPTWVVVLMNWRNALVSHLGLKTGPMPTVPPAHIRVGDQLGVFRVMHLGPNVALIGEDDSHLDFRIFVRLAAATPGAPSQLSVSTWVRTHNAMGRIYLLLVRPFHWLISVVVLRRLARQLTGQGH